MARQALSGSFDRTIKIWELQTGRLLRTFTGQERGEGSGAVRAESRNALCGSLDHTLRLWDLRYGKNIQTSRRPLRLSAVRVLQRWVLLLGHSQWCNAVLTTSNGRCALAGSHEGALRLWDLRTGDLIRSFVGHTNAVSAVAMAPDDRHAVSGSTDRTLRLWDLATGQLLHSFTEHRVQ